MKSPRRDDVSFQSFKTTACIWQPNKPGSYQKIQMYFLFTKSNYKLDWPRLSPAACIFIHQPRVKCLFCDVVFICLFNTKTWSPGSELMALPIPQNCKENIVMIKCRGNLNWLQEVDLPNTVQTAIHLLTVHSTWQCNHWNHTGVHNLLLWRSC